MKKFLCAVLALCMVLALAACGSGSTEPSAQPTDDGTHVNPGGVTPEDLMVTPEPTPTPDPEPITTLAINGISIVRDSQVGLLGYTGFEYADGVLTVSDTTVQGSDPVIYFEGGDLEIVVTGSVTFATSGAACIECGDGSNVTISGDGTINLSATDAAAIDMDGSLSVGCALNATGAPACSAADVSAAAGHSVTANDETTLTVA